MKKITLITISLILLLGCTKQEQVIKGNGNSFCDQEADIDIPNVSFELVDDSYDIYDPGSYKGYRYGASMILNDDGSLDMWLARPGNNSTHWDYIAYRHMYEDGTWSTEETVLWPNSGSMDHYSVCDPGVIYFGGYYYLGYTSTISSDAYQNQVFVARSEYPNGPFEKWNGSSWGGNPQAIITYPGTEWGAGEVSFVIKGEDLFIYYSWYDTHENSVRLSKADLVEDWPNTIRYKCVAFSKELGQDSSDIVYLDECDMFFAFTVGNRMTAKSNILVYCSLDGKQFYRFDKIKDIKEYAHNLGVSKRSDGHISVNDDLYLSYAYSDEYVWGQWRNSFQSMDIEYELEEKE